MRRSDLGVIWSVLEFVEACGGLWRLVILGVHAIFQCLTPVLVIKLNVMRFLEAVEAVEAK